MFSLAVWSAADTGVNPGPIDAVAICFSQHKGEHYSSHVTIGIGTVDYLNALVAAPFPTTFTFQLREHPPTNPATSGTAARQHHSFNLTH
jgi:hypothetical protein